jgi:YidC/Oxa1 family membrane protein insertase
MTLCPDSSARRNKLVKPTKWLLLTTLIAALFVLTGCGVPYEGVDVMNTPPQGFWQTAAVWPLAHALIWLDNLLQDASIPYHWGFAIILFTVVVKVVTFPLTLTQIRGMQAQKELAPKIQELQKKYGKDREKIAAEQMKLYKEAGVNPLSGCLPLLIQMPVLFALYAALVALGPSFNNANFFWIDDLGFPRYSEGMGWITDAFGKGEYLLLIGYLILPALLIATQFIMQKWMTVTTPSSNDGQAQMMQQMSLMMTFMFGFFTLTVPSGLTLYWVTSNLLQMLQQWLITTERFNLSGAKPANIAVPANAEAQLTDKALKVTSNGAEVNVPADGAANRPAKTPAARPRKPAKSKGK